MKTTRKSKKQGLPVQPMQSVTPTPAPAAASAEPAQQADGRPARVLPYVNYAERDRNRALPTETVLDMLRKWLPEQFGLAEVVGKWIWVTFPEQPAEQVRGQLSQFGFHWNNHRKCWQHPCGQFATEGSGADPRQKYGSTLAKAA